MESVGHWTQGSFDDFVYSISASFTAQLERRMQEKGVSRSALAEKLNKTSGRVSQVLNDPGNLGLRLIVEYARNLGMKVSVIAYDDGDPDNTKGPINPEVFVKSWEKLNRPADLFEVDDAPLLAQDALMINVTYNVPTVEAHTLHQRIESTNVPLLEIPKKGKAESAALNYLLYPTEKKPAAHAQPYETLSRSISQKTILKERDAA